MKTRLRNTIGRYFLLGVPLAIGASLLLGGTGTAQTSHPVEYRDQWLLDIPPFMIRAALESEDVAELNRPGFSGGSVT